MSNKNERNNNRKIKIPADAKKFSSSTLKKFKKSADDYFESKKELRTAYCDYLVELLPDTIEFVIKYGHINQEEIQEVKNGVYSKLIAPEFIKYLYKMVKDDDEIENIKLLPIIVKDILEVTAKENAARLAADPKAETYDLSDLAELSKFLLKKKIKKFTKAGISETLAFDVLSIIPCKQAMKFSPSFRVRNFFECLYNHAKVESVQFEKILNIVMDESYYPLVILQALLERKEKFVKLSDGQKTLWLDISTWCFDTMEKTLDKDQVSEIVLSYAKFRKNDDANNKDANRRYSLSSLSETEYPRIAKTIKKISVDNEALVKYL